MTGLISTLPHIITVAALWLVVVVIAQIVKAGVFRGMDTVQGDDETKKQNDERKKNVKKVVSLVNIGSTAVAVSVILLVVVFLSNPYERTHEGIKTTTPAVVDESFKEPTKAEIEKSNKEVTEKKHKEKEEAAERDNKAAMEEAEDIFRKATEETDKK